MSDDKADQLIEAVNRLADLLESVIWVDDYNRKYLRSSSL